MLYALELDIHAITYWNKQCTINFEFKFNVLIMILLCILMDDKQIDTI